MYQSFVLWATSLADPFAPTESVQHWRQQVVDSVNADLTGQTSAAVAELLAATGKSLSETDPWRQLAATPANTGNVDWWADTFIVDDHYNPLARQLAPIPTGDTITLIAFALQHQPGSAPVPYPSTPFEHVEDAVRCLVARFRAEEPGIEVREFMLDIAEQAWTLADIKHRPR